MKFKIVTYTVHQEDETTKEIAPRHGKRWVRVLIYFTLQHCVQLVFRKKYSQDVPEGGVELVEGASDGDGAGLPDSRPG